MRLITRKARDSKQIVFKTVNGITPIKIGRRIFVSGLDWQVLPNGGNYQIEARKIAKREREETGKPFEAVFVRRQADVVQAGFAVRGARARRGTVPLAAVAADALGPSFIAAFEVEPGKYAITGAMNDIILPQSDKYLDAVQARAHFQKLWDSLESSLGVEDFEVYAPEGFFKDAQPYAIDALARHVKRSHRLKKRPTFAPNDLARYFVWGCVLTALMAGGWIYASDQAEKSRLARQKTVAPAHPVTAAELAATRPWTHQAQPGVFAQRCTKSLGVLPLTMDGWVLANAHCEANLVAAQYARTQGRTSNGFSSAISTWSPRLQVAFSNDGDLATVTWAMSMPPGGDDGLGALQARKTDFLSYWQHRLISVPMTSSASHFAADYVTPKVAADPRLLHPNWQTLSWEIKDSPRNPTSLIEGLSVPGVRIQSISLAFGESGVLNWSLKGNLYGQ